MTPRPVADHDAVGVPLADRDLVDPDHLRRRCARSTQLLLHVLRVEGLDRLLVQPGFLGHILDRHGPAALPHEEGETLAKEQIIRKPVQGFLLHHAGLFTIDAINLHLQVDAHLSAWKIANSAYLPVVPGALDMPADATGRFFPRRHRWMTRAFGSLKIPYTVGVGRKPGKRSVSHRRRCVCIRPSCQISRPRRTLEFTPLPPPPRRCRFSRVVYPLTKEMRLSRNPCVCHRGTQALSLLSGALSSPSNPPPAHNLSPILQRPPLNSGRSTGV